MSYMKMKQDLENKDLANSNQRDDRTEMQKMRDKNEKSSKFFVQIGPSRVLSGVKHTNTIDYNPSRCKDWFDAGYCVFGDSCIFVHDRSDYKFGWELDKEFEAAQKKKEERRMKRLEALEKGE